MRELTKMETAAVTGGFFKKIWKGIKSAVNWVIDQVKDKDINININFKPSGSTGGGGGGSASDITGLQLY